MLSAVIVVHWLMDPTHTLTPYGDRYAKAEYWDDRFEKQVGGQGYDKPLRFFDWYMEYAEIVKFLPPSDAIHDVI
ncbi:hypothetical protein FOZ62_027014 [Perkinsus olseni]|uniref:Uncharacterized protein n=1 Tax=Perkinsus olseni TaxID=32597 RepID=A0A7J6PZ00_PEROL|nr:hypothetical protein FOZ62_027014 [Perkinsus olseni]